MTFGQFAFLILLVEVSIALLFWSLRRDRLLGLIVAASLFLRLLGSVATGEYLEQVRGREFLSDDEPAFQGMGMAILNDLSSKIHVEYEGGSQIGSMRGIYPYWNALVLWFWGPSLVPMRLANGLMATLGVIFAFILGQCLFPDRLAARIAALLVAFSPSLLIWSFSNLKETFLWVGILATVISFLAIADRWSWKNVMTFLSSVIFLASVRHYQAVVLVWLAPIGYLLCANMPLRRRVLRIGLILVLTGLAFYAIGGEYTSVLFSTAGETTGRYIVAERAEADVEYVKFPPDPRLVITNLPFVLFGRFDAGAGGGQFMSLLLLPEWVANFVITPLAFWGVIAGVRCGRYGSLYPMSFICFMALVLAWLHGDVVTTYRYRSHYWPLLLVLAGGGLSFLLRHRFSTSPKVGKAAGETVSQTTRLTPEAPTYG